MPFEQSYCPSCAEPVTGPGLKAPVDYYRCPQCREAFPRHKLPRRTMHRTVSLLWGTPVAARGVPFGFAGTLIVTEPGYGG